MGKVILKRGAKEWKLREEVKTRGKKLKRGGKSQDEGKGDKME